MLLSLLLIFGLTGCFDTKDPMPATVCGDVQVESYGTKLSMSSVTVKVYNDENTYYPEVKFEDEEQTKAAYEGKVDKKGTYDVKVTVTPAYSTSSYYNVSENAFVIEDGSYYFEDFYLELNI